MDLASMHDRSQHFIGPDDDPFSVALFALLAVVENGHN
jgi:hypothetical protein